ncbi:hypothetical protein [Brachyspira hyodysenteriae]|nr:hypothetical protein [Brachyspira hyodysenteriae]MCZ9896266.1 hypothetical protein [Brachyspira hyodysenteriae]
MNIFLKFIYEDSNSEFRLYVLKVHKRRLSQITHFSKKTTKKYFKRKMNK